MLLTELLPSIKKEIYRRSTNKGLLGVPTGIAQFDADLGGLPRQESSLILGLSNVGKTYFVLHLLEEAATWFAQGNKAHSAKEHEEDEQPLVVLFELEMSDYVTVVRLLSQMIDRVMNKQINNRDIRKGKLGYNVETKKWDDDQTLVALKGGFDALESIGKYIYIATDVYETSEMWSRLEGIRDPAKRDDSECWKGLEDRPYDVHLVLIDYFAKIADITMDASGVSRQQAVSAKLTRMAKEFDCHVHFIIDATREGEKAGRLNLSHIKWGSAVRYDCDYAIVAERPDLDEMMKDPVKYAYTKPPNYGEMILTIQKNRHGECPIIARVMLDPTTGRIRDINTGRR